MAKQVQKGVLRKGGIEILPLGAWDTFLQEAERDMKRKGQEFKFLAYGFIGVPKAKKRD